jgi:hypothetical protein
MNKYLRPLGLTTSSFSTGTLSLLLHVAQTFPLPSKINNLSLSIYLLNMIIIYYYLFLPFYLPPGGHPPREHPRGRRHVHLHYVGPGPRLRPLPWVPPLRRSHPNYCPQRGAAHLPIHRPPLLPLPLLLRHHQLRLRHNLRLGQRLELQRGLPERAGRGPNRVPVLQCDRGNRPVRREPRAGRRFARISRNALGVHGFRRDQHPRAR